MCENQAMQAPPLTRRERFRYWWQHDRPRIRRWLPGYGIAYRTTMKVMHYFGWHYAPREHRIDGDPAHYYHWCQWCGLRGETVNMEYARKHGPLKPIND